MSVYRAYANTTLNVPGGQGGLLMTVDESTGDGPARIELALTDTIQLAPFAVSVLIFP